MSPGKTEEYQVRDFMGKNVLTADSGSLAMDAVKAMVDRGIGSVVVLESGKPLGVFTERQVLRIISEGGDPRSVVLKETPLSSIARVSPAASAQESARRMMEGKGRLLVLDGERLVGVVTTTDILKVIYRTGVLFGIDSVISTDVFTMDVSARLRFVVREMDRRGVGSVILTEQKVPRAIFTERDLLNRVLYLGTDMETVALDSATFPIVTAELGINGRDVAGAMLARRIKRVPLTRDGKIVGIVTARDLVEAYAHPAGIENAEVAKQYRVRYGEVCPLCNTRIDDGGLCGCGVGGE